MCVTSPLTHIFNDEQPIPIATYILAIAAGNVCYRPFPKPEDKQWTSGVWAEPQLIDQAYWEFSKDTTRHHPSSIIQPIYSFLLPDSLLQQRSLWFHTSSGYMTFSYFRLHSHTEAWLVSFYCRSKYIWTYPLFAGKCMLVICYT